MHPRAEAAASKTAPQTSTASPSATSAIRCSRRTASRTRPATPSRLEADCKLRSADCLPVYMGTDCTCTPDGCTCHHRDLRTLRNCPGAIIAVDLQGGSPFEGRRPADGRSRTARARGRRRGRSRSRVRRDRDRRPAGPRRRGPHPADAAAVAAEQEARHRRLVPAQHEELHDHLAGRDDAARGGRPDAGVPARRDRAVHGRHRHRADQPRRRDRARHGDRRIDHRDDRRRLDAVGHQRAAALHAAQDAGPRGRARRSARWSASTTGARRRPSRRCWSLRHLLLQPRRGSGFITAAVYATIAIPCTA